MSDTINNNTTTDTIELYTCKECAVQFEMNLFSKTQINRLQYNKITKSQLINNIF